MASTSLRKSDVHRKTKETDIKLSLTIDGTGQTAIQTGVPFLDHMLTLLAVHGFFDLTISASGDTDVDDHHSVEDLGICLGQAFNKALGDFSSINRYGERAVPMDEALVRVILDFSNRPYLHYGITLADQKVGSFDTALAREFMRAFSLHAGLTLHAEMSYGENTHHIIEALFKALGKALDEATTVNPRANGPLSSKGTL